MHELEELRNRLDRAAGIADPLDRRLWVLGVVTEALSETGVAPILVGGSAVAFYTLGGYTTLDMDVVMPSLPEVDSALSALGFVRRGRHWVHEAADVVLEAPASVLAGDREKTSQVDVQGMTVRVIGIEDLVIDRLNAFVHWRSEEDGRWASRLLEIHHSGVDWEYLIRRAREERVEEALERVRREIIGGQP